MPRVRWMVVASFVTMAQMIPLSAVVPITPFAALLAAQAHPDFTGTWECDLKRSTVCPPFTTLIVKQTADTISMGGPDKPAEVYKLNSETVLDATVNARGEKYPAVRTTSKWEGSSLVMYNRPLDTPSDESKTVWRLSADGRELVLETTSVSTPSEPAIKHTFVKR